MTQSAENISIENLDRYVQHGYADNHGVKIHYASLGSGPLIVMIHGFPDFWYSWRYQMIALSSAYQVVAMDQRGYNLSDKPTEGEQYKMQHLIGDVKAVVNAQGKQSAIIIGHDWGGAVSWQFAMHYPDATEKLIILNLPHPRNMAREMVHNPEQQKNSQYARDFQQEGAHLKVTPEALIQYISDEKVRPRYLEAFQRSNIEGILQFYKQNYPREPYREDTSPVIKIKAPVLQFHGLKDKFLLPGALNNTWELIDNTYTLVTVPNAGHFIQHDTPELVTRTIHSWLSQ
ncbi:epoxide hydrolase [Dictyobacter alpinus]|uniref:Epoxide hydrolase n=1 Tax=Dictyobacter alpinus TaxID=2014873 RepID=A0A402BCM4_9CHLR|nr:alpha/beta hydrolase [Dictyobacter alpinus]GCE29032.1 epoxide hydrolase [Dictyobacter alpinus]